MTHTDGCVFIVIPAFNRLNFTKKCLFSLKKQTYKNYKIILIDDGSTDGTYQYVSSMYPDVKIIKGTGNWWWTRSMYEGVEWALKKARDNDYVLELNNDCYVSKDYLRQITNTARKYPNGIIGSLCYDTKSPALITEAGIQLDWSTGSVYGIAQTVSHDPNYYKNMDIIENIDALPGKGTLIPVRIIKKIGNFNYTRLPHYVADYEYTNRAKLKGCRLLVDTKAHVKNHWQATGITLKRGQKYNIKEGLSLMFGRRSMSNILDWINFVQIACPRKYIFRNIWFILCRFAVGLYSIKSIYVVVFFLQRIYNSIRIFILKPMSKIVSTLRLSVHRMNIKINQFPEYHLKKDKS